jgi:uncharacterized protein YndB with AHSA1/START domain
MSTTTHPQTEITADPATPTIVITREFDAPPSKVFRAHTDRDLVVQWLGPNGTTNRIDRWEPRTGGSWRYVSELGGQEFGFYGSFHEIRPDERIVQTFTYEGVPDAVNLEILTLIDLGGGRTRLVAQSVYDSIDSRDGMVASGMETGVVDGYERLDGLLAG